MRSLLIGLAVVTMALPAAIEPAAAQRPWCIIGSSSAPGGGLPHCAFQTFAQCQASLGGGRDACIRNPDLQWDRRDGTPSRRKARDRDY